MKQMICITCPAGCRLEAEYSGGIITVSGNGCKRGEEFALAELTHPMRSLTSTVRTSNPMLMLPVRTDREIPKDKLKMVMKLLRGVVVDRPVACGEVIVDLAPVCEGYVIATCDFI